MTDMSDEKVINLITFPKVETLQVVGPIEVGNHIRIVNTHDYYLVTEVEGFVEILDGYDIFQVQARRLRRKPRSWLEPFDQWAKRDE